MEGQNGEMLVAEERWSVFWHLTHRARLLPDPVARGSNCLRLNKLHKIPRHCRIANVGSTAFHRRFTPAANQPRVRYYNVFSANLRRQRL